MENFKSNLDAYADYLDEHDCEFIIAVHNKEDDDTRVMYSTNAAPLLSAIFDKSDDVYGLFKRAERLMDLPPTFVGLN